MSFPATSTASPLLKAATASDETILIVGAGLAGLALSLGLTRHHHPRRRRVEILERRRDFTNTGATFGLNPAGIKALDELCCFCWTNNNNDNDNGGSTTTNSVMDSLRQDGIVMPHSGGLMLAWHKVRDALLSEVRNRSDAIRIHLNCRIESIQEEQNEQFVSVKYHQQDDENDTAKEENDGTSGSTRQTKTLKGQLLVGCDGVNSIVRRHLGLAPARETGVSTWRGTIVVPHDNDILEPLFEKGIAPIGLPNYGNMVTVGIFNFHSKVPRMMTWTINSKEEVVLPSTPPSQCIEKYMNDTQNLAYFREIIRLSNHDDLHHVIDLKTIDPQTWKYKGNRISVIADAAHAMRPASGLGGSLAFEDCVILCRELDKIQKENDGSCGLQQLEAVQQALQAVLDLRLPRVEKIWRMEWDSAEASYKGIPRPVRTPEYNQWVANGV